MERGREKERGKGEIDRAFFFLSSNHKILIMNE